MWWQYSQTFGYFPRDEDPSDAWIYVNVFSVGLVSQLDYHWNFPHVVMREPFTVLGVIADGTKLSLCWPRCFMNSWPAADKSAPESGSTSTLFVLVELEILTVIVGADSVALSFMLYSWIWSCTWLVCA